MSRYSIMLSFCVALMTGCQSESSGTGGDSLSQSADTVTRKEFIESYVYDELSLESPPGITYDSFLQSVEWYRRVATPPLSPSLAQRELKLRKYTISVDVSGAVASYTLESAIAYLQYSNGVWLSSYGPHVQCSSSGYALSQAQLSDITRSMNAMQACEGKRVVTSGAGITISIGTPGVDVIEGDTPMLRLRKNGSRVFEEDFVGNYLAGYTHRFVCGGATKEEFAQTLRAAIEPMMAAACDGEWSYLFDTKPIR